MKIIQLVTRRQRRGAEVFAAQLSDGLARKGHEVQFIGLFSPPPDPLTPALADAYDFDGTPGRRLSLSLITELAELFRHIAPDVVQANGSATLKYASIAKVVSRGTWPLIYRNISIASHWLRNPCHRWWGKLLLRNVNHVAAVSEESRLDFSCTYGIPESRISTIPIGVEIPLVRRVNQARRELLALGRISGPCDVVVTAGSLSPEKNHLWLIDAFSRIVVGRPSAHLFLIGDGPLKLEVETAIARMGLQGNVHVIGSRDDVPSLLAGADVFVLPSVIEGIPGVVLEAAAQGVPTVATAVGSISEAVKDGRTGLLVPLGDMSGFVAALIELLDDRVRRRQLDVATREFVIERYKIEHVIHEFGSLYANLTERLASRRPFAGLNGQQVG